MFLKRKQTNSIFARVAQGLGVGSPEHARTQVIPEGQSLRFVSHTWPAWLANMACPSGGIAGLLKYSLSSHSVISQTLVGTCDVSAPRLDAGDTTETGQTCPCPHGPSGPWASQMTQRARHNGFPYPSQGSSHQLPVTFSQDAATGSRPRVVCHRAPCSAFPRSVLGLSMGL